MKTVAFLRQPRQELTRMTPVAVYPDSAVTLPGRPIVVPDMETPLRLLIGIGVRVQRLGKGVEPRFASRHIDSVTAVALMTPVQDMASISGRHCLPDNAVTAGEWTEYQADAPLTIEVNGTTYEASAAELAIAEAVAEASRFATIKTGDIIVATLLAECTLDDLKTLGDRLTVSLNDKPVINKRII